MRTHSPSLAQALTDGLRSAGMDVIDVGMIDTSMIYFAINHEDAVEPPAPASAAVSLAEAVEHPASTRPAAAPAATMRGRRESAGTRWRDGRPAVSGFVMTATLRSAPSAALRGPCGEAVTAAPRPPLGSPQTRGGRRCRTNG